MNLMYLRYFIVIADCSNYTEAAKRLYISQPTLSYSIAALEKELDTKLFIRNRQPISLTPAGEVLYHIAKEIIQLVDQAYTAVKASSGTEPYTLNIGFLGDFLLPYCFQTIISPFMMKYSHIRSNLTQCKENDLYASLINRSTDIIISRSSLADRQPLEGGDYKVLGEDFFCLIVGSGHPYAKYTYLEDLSVFQDEVLLLPDPGRTASLNQKILDICESLNFHPKIQKTNLLYDSLIPMVSCGAGVTVISKSLADASQVANIQKIDIGSHAAVANHIVAIWMKENQNPSLQIFVDYLNKNF